MRFLECNYCCACSIAKDSIYFATIESKTVQSLLNQSRDISSRSSSTGRATCKSVLTWDSINFLIRNPWVLHSVCNLRTQSFPVDVAGFATDVVTGALPLEVVPVTVFPAIADAIASPHLSAFQCDASFWLSTKQHSTKIAEPAVFRSTYRFLEYFTPLFGIPSAADTFWQIATAMSFVFSS